MAPDHPRGFGPGVSAAIDHADLGPEAFDEVANDRGVALLRPPDPSPYAVLQQHAGDTAAVLEEADRLLWLAGSAPAPKVIASGRNDHGDEAVVIGLGPDASCAIDGHPMGPEALLTALAEALTTLHSHPIEHCPFTADTLTLRGIVEARIAQGLVADAVEGPYAGRTAVELARVFDELLVDLGEAEAPVFVHGAVAAERLWLDPSGEVRLLGWQWSGVGDRHVDLAAAATLLSRLHGPALVAPFFEAYGFDRVDLRRLDAHQLLAHLLT